MLDRSIVQKKLPYVSGDHQFASLGGRLLFQQHCAQLLIRENHNGVDLLFSSKYVK